MCDSLCVPGKTAPSAPAGAWGDQSQGRPGGPGVTAWATAGPEPAGYPAHSDAQLSIQPAQAGMEALGRWQVESSEEGGLASLDPSVQPRQLCPPLPWL